MTSTLPREERADAAPGRAARLTSGQRWIVASVGIGAAAIAGIGFAGSYQAVSLVAAGEGFGGFSNAFPLGVDLGIGVLYGLDLFLTWLRIPFPLLRAVAWLLTVGTITFNAAAARDALGVGMHATIPLLFVVIVEAARHAVGRLAAITADRHIERIRLLRWVLAPYPTFRLWRRMYLFEIRQYDEAIRGEIDRLVYRTRMRATHGRRWRRQAPVDLVLPHKLSRFGVPIPAEGALPALAGPTVQLAGLDDHVAGALALVAGESAEVSEADADREDHREPTTVNPADPDREPDREADADREDHREPTTVNPADPDREADADREDHREPTTVNPADPGREPDREADADREGHREPTTVNPADPGREPDREADANREGHREPTTVNPADPGREPDREADADREGHREPTTVNPADPGREADADREGHREPTTVKRTRAPQAARQPRPAVLHAAARGANKFQLERATAAAQWHAAKAANPDLRQSEFAASLGKSEGWLSKAITEAKQQGRGRNGRAAGR